MGVRAGRARDKGRSGRGSLGLRPPLDRRLRCPAWLGVIRAGRLCESESFRQQGLVVGHDCRGFIPQRKGGRPRGADTYQICAGGSSESCLQA